jgi:hypothetical protein
MSKAISHAFLTLSGVLAACTPAKEPDRVVAKVDDVADAAIAEAPDAAEPDAAVAPREETDDDREQANAEKLSSEGKRGCAGQTRLIAANGEVSSCYPYRCRANACLRRCKTTDDCVPSAKPGESTYVKGWPILCGGHVAPAAGKTAECLPLPPHDVHPPR